MADTIIINLTNGKRRRFLDTLFLFFSFFLNVFIDYSIQNSHTHRTDWPCLLSFSISCQKRCKIYELYSCTIRTIYYLICRPLLAILLLPGCFCSRPLYTTQRAIQLFPCHKNHNLI